MTEHPRAGPTAASDRVAPDRVAQLPALTSLRFFAAFAVLALHYRDLLGPLPAWLLKALVGGQYGVTFFFVLSGFILTYNYQGWFGAGVQAAGFWRFQRLRLARIYPIYVVGLLLDTPWHLIERANVGQLADSGHVYWASWLLNLVGLQAWVPGVPYAMFWNAPAWSVSAEFFFYASFPFVCALLARRIATFGGLLVALVATVLAETALYAVVVHLLTFVWKAESQTQYLVMVYNPLLRFGEFVAGCLAGQYFVRSRGLVSFTGAGLWATTMARNSVIVVSLLLVAARVMMPDYTGPSANTWLLDVALKYPFYILPFVALILAVASGPSFLSGLLALPWLVLLGEASYSLYIIHWSGQTFLRMGFLGSLGTPLVHALFLLGTVAASVFFYRVVEVPWRRRLRGAA
jgi:peptidoglycan/LPS O-acetylase OafA/YrhL